MLELGADAASYHEELGKQAAAAGIDGLISIGDFAPVVLRSARDAGLSGGCLAECRRDEIAELLLDCWLEPGAVVLVKGSRAMKMENLVEQIRDLARTQTTPEVPIRRAA